MSTGCYPSCPYGACNIMIKPLILQNPFGNYMYISNQIRTAKSILHSEHEHYLFLSKKPHQHRLAEIHRAAHVMDGLNKPAEVWLHK